MSEDKDKIELKPDAKESGDKSDKKSGNKDDKKSPSSHKTKTLFIVFAIFAILIIIGMGLFLRYHSTNNSNNSGPEEELTRAEEQEQYHLASTASDETKNIVALSNAWAYYYEENYYRALEILDSMVNMDESTTSSQRGLYASIYEAQGNVEKAREYNVLILNEYENQLLEQIKNNSDEPDLHYELAEMYRKASEDQKAVIQYKAYIEAMDENVGSMEEYEYETLQNAKQALEELGQ